ncbi:MAG TPA: cytochrome c3 family protein [Methylomirabilota bacterium]|nr:cytochrome c3 family protein [Methylomirabilota bacterium]
MTLICSECHDQQEPTSGQPRLLNGSSANQMCLSCHDNKDGIPDVSGENANALGGPRQGGALTTATAGYEAWKGHALDATAPPPGGAWPGGETRLRCVSCHSPHGNASYRNLGGVLPDPPLVTYTTSLTPTNAVEVRIDLPAVPAVGSRVAAGFYSATRIYFNQPSTLGSGYSAFCGGCHNDFHGVAQTGVARPFRRHPSDGVGMPVAYVTRYNSRANRVPLLIAGNGAGAGATIASSVSCVSCHRAHGNRNPFGLILMKPTGLVTEEGVDGGRLTDLCSQCHSEGG